MFNHCSCDVIQDVFNLIKEDIVRVRLEYGARVGIMQGLKKRNSHKWYFINKVINPKIVDTSQLPICIIFMDNNESLLQT